MITRAFTRLALWALTALLTLSSFAADEDPKRVVATVNGLEITELRLKDAQSPADRKEKLEKLIDDTLLLHAAQKLNITIPPEIMQDRIETIVRESFAGDRFKFENQLEAAGYSMKAYEKLQEETILVLVMRQHITKDWADQTSRQQALASWLTAAREKASISYK
jgi:hypothetical protein